MKITTIIPHIPHPLPHNKKDLDKEEDEDEENSV
jgi:hypothetical protein